MFFLILLHSLLPNTKHLEHGGMATTLEDAAAARKAKLLALREKRDGKGKRKAEDELEGPSEPSANTSWWPHDSAEYGYAGYLLCIETLMLQQGKREDMTRQRNSIRWKSKSLVYLAR